MATVSGVIRPAETEEELETIFRLRADVFFGENILKFGHTNRLTDDLDRHAASVNLAVVTHRRGLDRRSNGVRYLVGASAPTDLVGAVRVTFPAPGIETTSSVFFDFTEFVAGDGAGTACGSMLCVRADYRRSRLGTTLTRAIMEVSRQRSMRYLCVAARPISVPFLTRLGWNAVAPQFDHPLELVPVVPMVVDLATVPTSTDADRRIGDTFALV